ncbi:conserved hypothetical protein [Theileria equi strain WA]|uniref:Signal peptide-containing protein n=1 Tax=Theileria equi strain WA TaxID=1537102 RepID=L1LCD1_THEEQ|nr:conserved hypothetical protein [Theileria equi strain WA]EKX73102.1 conserved hypothetical protein [Theileria equi strain WA]|eukprot:XP_004832554.1 conserved hypothetical protein [Theileria equi strain WA]
MHNYFFFGVAFVLSINFVTFTSGIKVKDVFASKLQQDGDHIPNDYTNEGLTFAELGSFFTPVEIADGAGNSVYSFLHTATGSTGVNHDSVTASKKSLNFKISGTVKGLIKDQPLTVMVGTTYGSRYDMLLEQVVDVNSPRFTFSVPRGTFYLKVEGIGYFLPGAVKVPVPCKSAKCPFLNDTNASILEVKFANGYDSIYSYNWKLQNVSQFGVEYVNKVPQDEASLLTAFEGNVSAHVDSSDAAAKLKLMFGIELHGVWGSEYASRLLSVISKFTWMRNRLSKWRKNQKWLLTNEALYPQDVQITRYTNRDQDSEYEQVVQISRDAFKFSNKQAIDKKSNGFYFSRRLYKAVIRAICLHNPAYMKHLFKELHNVEILEPYELEHKIRTGTRISRYPSTHYQSWFKHPEELVEIATSWMEYPLGLHKVKGLKYFLRRVDGMVNPEEPTAPAIAYPSGPNVDSYIEFMECGFRHYPDVSQLVLHEIAHFVDFNTIPADIRAKWVQIGGWVKDPRDPDGWSTRQQTEFVRAYAHKKNPSEDFACSLADYVLNPRLLRSRAPRKYDFVKNHIMGGSYYVVKASHEFQVLNLGNPDYMFSGRLQEIDVNVTGRINEPKKVKFNMKLLDHGPDTCATYIRFRLASESGTFVDVSMSNHRCSHTFSTEIVMNQYMKRGIWTTDQIVVGDDNGLVRYVGTSDFGLRVWINNGSEDYQDPRAIISSVGVALISKGNTNIVRTTWLLVDDGELKDANTAYAAINGSTTSQHSLAAYSGMKVNTPIEPNNGWRTSVWSGSRKVPTEYCLSQGTSANFNGVSLNKHKFSGRDNYFGLTPEESRSGLFNCYQIATNIPLSSASRTGSYYLTRITSYDSAGNSQLLQWPDKTGPFVQFTSLQRNPDNSPPQVRNIAVSSRPTNPRAPNGETEVTITFELGDFQSGISTVWIKLRDPFGADVLTYPRFANSKGWQTIRHVHVLPRGSIPGIWHLAKIYAEDNAGNELSLDLAERVLVSSRA